MSLLTIVQNTADAIGIDQPLDVISSTNKTSIQMLSLLNRSGQMLARRFNWNRLIKEQTVITVASTASYALPKDFVRIIDNTLWDRTNYWKMRGSISPQEWQFRKSAIAVQGIRKRIRVFGNLLYIDPTPTAIETLVYEYVSDQWTTDSGGTNPSNKYNADGDLSIFPEYLLELDLIWRFRKTKGLDYGEEFRDFQTQFELEKQNDKPSETLMMEPNRLQDFPVNVPETGFGP